MNSMRSLSSCTAFAALRIGAVVLALALAATSLNGCLTGGGGECDTTGVPAVNVTATAGDGSAALTWEIPEYDTDELDAVHSMVLYAAQGGAGEQCAGANINHTPEGCVVGCQSTSGTQCTVTGLQNAVAYTFTVITTAYPHSLYSCAKESFVRTEAVTPVAPVAP